MELKVYRRPDRQWKCGLTSSGIACPLGPDDRGRCHSQNCHPQRTLRWWRGYLPIALGTATVGILITMITTQQHREVVAPGPLARAHAQLIQNPNDPHRCASCHEDSSGVFAKQSIDEKFAVAHTQTQRCMVCHLRELTQLKRGTPHDLTSDHLDWMTDIAALNQKSPAPKSRLVNFVKLQAIDWHQHSLACSTCHREHQGAQHDLQTIASQRCQACHQNQFNSFSIDHPEFSDYPAKSVSRLSFDHSSHRDLHFTKTNTEFQCRVCHVNGAEQGRVGQVFRSVAFETACASCHLAPMQASLPDGIIVFQLPSIDIRGLAQRGLPIGDWPDEAGQFMDGKVPPLMRLLLMVDTDFRVFSDQLPDSGKLSDFDLDANEDREALKALAITSRRLLERLAHGGQQTIQERLTALSILDNREFIEKLMQGIPPDLFRQAYREWFEPQRADPIAPAVKRVSSTITLTSKKVVDDSNDLLRESETKAATDSLLADPGSDRLLDNPLRNDDLLDSSASLLNSNSEDATIETLSPSWKPLKARQHLTAGGWMIDKQRMAIVYVPTGHADPWLTAMLSLGQQLSKASISHSSTSGNSFDKQLIEEISIAMLDKKNVGRCTECHRSIDISYSTTSLQEHLTSHQESSGKTASILWRADRFDARVRELTYFDHGPHLIQSSLANCVACHRSRQPEASASIIHQSDFESMKVKDCAACHRPNAAGEHCTQCHNYHSNFVEP